MYSLYIGYWWETKDIIPPTSSLVNEDAHCGCLKEHEWLKGRCITPTWVMTHTNCILKLPIPAAGILFSWSLSAAIVYCFYDLGWCFPHLVKFNRLPEPYTFHLLPKFDQSPALSTGFSSMETVTMLDQKYTQRSHVHTHSSMLAYSAF